MSGLENRPFRRAPSPRLRPSPRRAAASTSGPPLGVRACQTRPHHTISESPPPIRPPNGDFDEGRVRWTPAEAIRLGGGVFARTSPNALRLGGNSGITSYSSDASTIPPGRKSRLSGYVINPNPSAESAVAMEIASPQRQEHWLNLVLKPKRTAVTISPVRRSRVWMRQSIAGLRHRTPLSVMMADWRDSIHSRLSECDAVA